MKIKIPPPFNYMQKLESFQEFARWLSKTTGITFELEEANLEFGEETYVAKLVAQEVQLEIQLTGKLYNNEGFEVRLKIINNDEMAIIYNKTLVSEPSFIVALQELEFLKTNQGFNRGTNFRITKTSKTAFSEEAKGVLETLFQNGYEFYVPEKTKS